MKFIVFTIVVLSALSSRAASMGGGYSDIMTAWTDPKFTRVISVLGRDAAQLSYEYSHGDGYCYQVTSANNRDILGKAHCDYARASEFIREVGGVHHGCTEVINKYRPNASYQIVRLLTLKGCLDKIKYECRNLQKSKEECADEVWRSRVGDAYGLFLNEKLTEPYNLY